MSRKLGITLVLVALAVATATAYATEHEADRILRASRTIGLDVVNRQQQDLGQVNDFAIGAGGDRITHVIVSAGGVLGVGRRLHPVPIEAVQIVDRSQWQEGRQPVRRDDRAAARRDDTQADRAADQTPDRTTARGTRWTAPGATAGRTTQRRDWVVVINVSEDRFNDAPVLDDGVDGLTDVRIREVQEFYAVRRTWDPGDPILEFEREDADPAQRQDTLPGTRQDTLQDTARSPEDQRVERVRRQRLLSLNDLLDTDVRSLAQRTDETLGTLREIVFEIPSGKIRYGALGYGGLLGFGEELYAIPWDTIAFTRPVGDDQVQYLTIRAQITERNLRDGRGFAEDDRGPSEADDDWLTTGVRVGERDRDRTRTGVDVRVGEQDQDRIRR